MSRTLEQIADTLTQYLMGGSYYANVSADEAKALILAALNEATAQRDAEIARLREQIADAGINGAGGALLQELQQENARLRECLTTRDKDHLEALAEAVAVETERNQLRAALAGARGLVTAQEDCIDLLVAELNDVVPMAAIHHWRTTRAEAGVKARAAIAKAKQALARIDEMMKG